MAAAHDVVRAWVARSTVGIKQKRRALGRFDRSRSADRRKGQVSSREAENAGARYAPGRGSRHPGASPDAALSRSEYAASMTAARHCQILGASASAPMKKAAALTSCHESITIRVA